MSEYDDNVSPYDNTIQFVNIELEDWSIDKEKLIPICEKVFKLIKTTNENILIHCNEGRSRSVSMIIYYLIKHHKYTYEDAYNYINNIKSNVRINSAFVAELKSFK